MADCDLTLRMNIKPLTKLSALMARVAACPMVQSAVQAEGLLK